MTSKIGRDLHNLWKTLKNVTDMLLECRQYMHLAYVEK